MNKNTLFPVMDRLTQSDCQKLNLKLKDVRGPLVSLGMPVQNVRAKWTGEKRAPKAGEWFLSGAEVGAYLTKNDLTSVYHIAKLVIVKVETVTREIEII